MMKKISKEQARDKHTETYLKKKKNQNRNYGRNRYNMSEEKKHRLREYQKNYRETKKLK